MSNLNKTYHKGKFRGGEWAKHIRPYLKRLGNNRFRKVASVLEEQEFDRFAKAKKKKRRNISAKITVKSYGGKKVSYYRKYRTIKDLENALNRPNVICYSIIAQEQKPDKD